MAGEHQAGGFRQVQDVAGPDRERLRVGLFTNNYLPMLGGVSTSVETVRMTLERLGHEVWVVAPRPAGATDAPRVLRVPAWPAPTYPDFSLPLPATPHLVRAVRRLELDVFHAQHPFLLGGTARRIARRLGRPLVFTYHTLYDKYAHYVPLPRPLVACRALRWSTAFANTADAVLVASDALATRLRSQGVQRRVEVVPTGIDLERFRPGDRRAARRALGLPLDARTLLYVGRLDREKNLVFLLDAFERIAARLPDLRLVLVGRGTQERALRALAASRPTAHRVHFVGGVLPTDVVRYYQAADLFVFSSTTETQGLAVLEAMATGLPVVAIRASGVEEAVVDGVTGLLVPEDTAAFAAAAVEVLGDQWLRAKLAAGGREAVLGFSAPALAERLVTIYRSLMSGPAFTAQRGIRHDRG